VAFAANVFACWVIPYRLRYDPGNSYYTFAYIGDEYTYSQRLQPLIAGTTRSNPVNGICDPKVVSQFYLEDTLRELITLTGLDVVTCIWIWRIIFPPLLAILFLQLARCCLPESRKPYAKLLTLAAGTAGMAIFFALYEVCLGNRVPHGWINRVPTNLEYPLSILLACFFVRFVQAPTERNAFVLSATGALLVYMRPYVAAPWGLALALSISWMTLRRMLSFRTAAVILGTLFVTLLPWVLIARHNAKIHTYQEMVARYLLVGWPYEVHKRWAVHVAIAAALLLAGFLTERRYRLMLWPAAGVMAILPFILGLAGNLSHELLLDDRYSPFYLVMLLIAAFLVLRQQMESWRGRDRLGASQKTISALLAACAILAIWHAGVNLKYDFRSYEPAQFAQVAEDTQCVPAYKWIRENTPKDALFIVDDGHDWTMISPDNTGLLLDHVYRFCDWNDLFQVVSQRRRVYGIRLYGLAIAEPDYLNVVMLHLGTFGFPIAKEAYVEAFKKYQPTHIFWRRTAPVPRGYGKTLEKLREVIYSDGTCEVWKLKY